MPRSLVLLVFALLSFPVFSSVEITPERVLMLPTIDRATGTPLIASNGNGYLVVWSGRLSTFVLPLDDRGRPARDRAVPIAGPADRLVIDIASDGTNYLVVIGTPAGISTLAVDASANVIATSYVAPLDAASASILFAHVAWNGEEYLLAWAAMKQLVGIRLDRGGHPIGQPFMIAEDRVDPDFAIASNGRDFLIATLAGSRLQTIVVTASGNVAAPRDIVAGRAFVAYPALAFTGSAYVLMWADRDGDRGMLNEAALSVDAVPIGPVTVVATAEPHLLTLAPALARTADGVTALFRIETRVWALRIDTPGNPTGAAAAVLEVSPGQLTNIRIRAASNGREVFAAWAEEGQFVYGSAIDAARLQRGTPLARSALQEFVVATGSAGRMQLVLWCTTSPFGQYGPMRATRLIDGVPDGDPVTVADEPAIGSITTDGTDFLVTWWDPARTRGRIVPASGLPGPVIDFGQHGTSATAAWTGRHYLVLWTELTYSGESGFTQRLSAVRVSGSGEVLDSVPRTMTAAPGFNTADAHVLRTRAGLVAVFLHGLNTIFRGYPVLAHDVYLARISDDENFAGTPVQLTNTEDSESAIEAAVDADGNLLITWLQWPLDYHFEPSSHAAMVDSGFRVVRQFDFGTSRQRRAVAGSGHSFFMSWYEPTVDRIALARYSPAGDALPVEPWLSAGGTPFLSPIANGVFAAYARPLPEENGGDAPRIVTRMIYDLEKRRSVIR
jgi:hypothetical protein